MRSFFPTSSVRTFRLVRCLGPPFRLRLAPHDPGWAGCAHTDRTRTSKTPGRGCNALLDEKSAGEVAWELWNRKSYQTAHTLWTSWLGTTQLLANTRFDTAPRATRSEERRVGKER